MRTYGQFCPVAKAAEVLSERWTLLIVRELLAGSHRFNALRRGIPLISTSLLSQRLKALEYEGIVERRPDPEAQGCEYHLTEAGAELGPMVELAGRWGQRWIRSKLLDEELDVGLLMWDMRRRIDTQALPEDHVCIHFHYPDVRSDHREWWLLVDAGEVDLCPRDPGREPDLDVMVDSRTMCAIWIGNLSLHVAAQQGHLKLCGSRALRNSIHKWLELSVFADVPPARRELRFTS